MIACGDIFAVADWFNLPAVYAFCLALGAGYTILVAVLGSFGGGFGHFDHGGFEGHDLGHGGDHDTGHGGAHMGPFSPLIIASFLTCFGGTGLLFTKMVSLGRLSLAPAGGAAVAFAGATIWIFNRLFARVEATSQAKACDLVGRVATVITPIPQGPGAGAIAYVINGTRYSLAARSEDAVAMDRGSEAVILRVTGPSCFVAPPGDERSVRAIRHREQMDAGA